MKYKLMALCSVVVASSMVIGGCSLKLNDIQTSGTNIEQTQALWQTNMPSDTVAVVLNDLTKSQIKSLGEIEKVSLDDGKDSFIFATAVDGVDVQVWSVKLEGDTLVNNELKFEKKSANKDFFLELEAERADSIPTYKIVVGDSTHTLEYLITNNGSEDTKAIEYLSYQLPGKK